jgi:4a-hydroxytetrahydrobiopterin dehydratase
MKLAEQKCQPISKDDQPLLSKEVTNLSTEIPAWYIGKNFIKREFKFETFRQAVDFTSKVAALAEEQDHHPDICIYYNEVELTLSTHKIGGLSQNDFILAAKIDLLI